MCGACVGVITSSVTRPGGRGEKQDYSICEGKKGKMSFYADDLLLLYGKCERLFEHVRES